jgi:hypothetical protein
MVIVLAGGGERGDVDLEYVQEWGMRRGIAQDLLTC